MNSSLKGPCEYCSRDGNLISDKHQQIDVYVCHSCMNLLKNPRTALPLIRGHLSIEGRSHGPEHKKQLEKFMEMISKWGSKN